MNIIMTHIHKVLMKNEYDNTDFLVLGECSMASEKVDGLFLIFHVTCPRPHNRLKEQH